MQYVADLEPNPDGAMQIMYGIDGRRDLTESTRDDLSGYAGARPVRIGNGAFDQRQNDVYGAVLDCILLHTRRSQRLSRRLWPIVESQAECAMRVWREPDQGIWEARGAPQQYVSSKLMCWVAMDRAAKLADIRGDTEQGARWRAVAEEIRADILEHGVDARGVAAPALRDRRARRLEPAGRRLRVPPGRRSAAARDRAGDRGRADRERLRPALPHRGDRRRPVRPRGDVPDLLVLARLGAGRDRRAAAGARPDGAPAAQRVAARPLRRGARRRHRPPPRELPAGVLAPRADRGGRAHHRRRTSRRSTRYEPLRRDRDRQRRRRRHARAPARALRQAGAAARARRLAGARAAELVGGGRLRRQPLRLRGHLVRRARQAVPAADPLLRRRRHEALRRRAVPAARGGLRRAGAPRRQLARVAGRLRRVRALLHAGRAALPGARRARGGPDRAARQRALPAPGRQPRAAHPAALRRPGGGRAAPVPRALRRDARRGRPRPTAAACAARRATASRAWCTRSPTPRCWRCARR